MRTNKVFAALVFLLGAATTAQAQSPVAPPPGPGAGTIRVERVYSRFVVGPDYRLTRIDGTTGQLVGVSGGWLNEELLYVGGAFYWLAGGASAWDMYYGGVVFGLQMPVNRRISFGGRVLTGIGDATKSTTLGELYRNPYWSPLDARVNRARHSNGRLPIVDGGARVDVSDTFFVFEPEGTVSWKITDRIRFGVSAGYRFTGEGDVYDFDDRLSGATGSVTVQFGLGGS